ncbi:MAG TPA: hypothetical protein VHN74_00040 [Candidatus Angelobacter sp.]|jgi:anti-sigma factor RsiW|nr:hypothetical protein [Candidatus Angelobacter sp.]
MDKDKHNDNNHQKIRASLALAAVSALEPAVQSQVEAHLESCEPCRKEFSALRGLASDLRVLPPPVLAFGLAQRTSARVRAELAARSERRRHNLVLLMVTVFAWIDTLIILAIARMFGNDIARLLHVSDSQLTFGFVVYWLVAVAATVALTGHVGRVHRQRRLV